MNVMEIFKNIVFKWQRTCRETLKSTIVHFYMRLRASRYVSSHKISIPEALLLASWGNCK